jgi:hypothetical protein
MEKQLTDELLLYYLKKRLKDSNRELGELIDYENPDRYIFKPSILSYVVLKDFDTSNYIIDTVKFLQKLSKDERSYWYNNFTPTIFLFGNPLKLKDRINFMHISEKNDIGWIAPSNPDKLRGGIRLLKLIDFSNIPFEWKKDIIIPFKKDGQPVQITIATGELTFQRYLIHLNHTICEGFITGVISEENVIHLNHVTVIYAIHKYANYVRVQRSEIDPDRLVAYSVITKGI